MKQKDKELLLKDLTARMLYGVCVHIIYKEGEPCYGKLTPKDIRWFIDSKIENIKPYLRPMSSMTEEEKEELSHLLPKDWSVDVDKFNNFYFNMCSSIFIEIDILLHIIDWINAHHFDYRGLIEKCLAIEAPKDMYTNN